MPKEVVVNWLELHEWRKAHSRYTDQRELAAAWWIRWYRTNKNVARRMRRFIKAHSLSMVDVLHPNMTWEYFMRDANKVGARTRKELAAARKPHPGPRPIENIKLVA